MLLSAVLGCFRASRHRSDRAGLSARLDKLTMEIVSPTYGGSTTCGATWGQIPPSVRKARMFTLQGWVIERCRPSTIDTTT
jgi:hypothetical protein